MADFLLNRPKIISSSLTKFGLKSHSNHDLLQTETNYNVCKTQKLRYLVHDFGYFFEKIPDDFAQNLPQCTRLSIRAMEKNKA